MSEIWFIRHGESESNAGLPTADTRTTAITARGRAEAEIVARTIPATPDLIVTSPYIRTKQTAEPTMRRFPSVPHDEWPVHEFTYLALHAEVATTYHDRQPFVKAFWDRSDPHYLDGEGVESFAMLMLRVAAAQERMNAVSGDFVLVFSHGLFMKALLWSLIFPLAQIDMQVMGRYRAFLRAVSMPNGAILKLRTGDRGGLWFSGIITDHMAALE